MAPVLRLARALRGPEQALAQGYRPDDSTSRQAHYVDQAATPVHEAGKSSDNGACECRYAHVEEKVPELGRA